MTWTFHNATPYMLKRWMPILLALLCFTLAARGASAGHVEGQAGDFAMTVKYLGRTSEHQQQAKIIVRIANVSTRAYYIRGIQQSDISVETVPRGWKIREGKPAPAKDGLLFEAFSTATLQPGVAVSMVMELRDLFTAAMPGAYSIKFAAVLRQADHRPIALHSTCDVTISEGWGDPAMPTPITSPKSPPIATPPAPRSSAHAAESGPSLWPWVGVILAFLVIATLAFRRRS